MAPQDIALGGGDGLGRLAPVSEHAERSARHLPQLCWHAAVAFASAFFSVSPVAASKCFAPAATARAAQVSRNRYTILQLLPCLPQVAKAAWLGHSWVPLFQEIPSAP